jgi:hypothetical protein
MYDVIMMSTGMRGATKAGKVLSCWTKNYNRRRTKAKCFFARVKTITLSLERCVTTDLVKTIRFQSGERLILVDKIVSPEGH